MKRKENISWSTEYIVLFAIWLIEKKHQHGYGLLCIHGSCLGLKIGALLKLKWDDFIDEGSGECKSDLIIYDKKGNEQQIPLSDFIQRYTENVYQGDFYDEDRTIESEIYINSNSGKLLSTTTLNRELDKLYEEFRLEVLESTNLELCFEPLKTNTFEICWARDMVKKYHYNKKAFIMVSKYMGHRTVNDTINILGVEPNEDMKVCYDLYNPTVKEELELTENIENKQKLKSYLLGEKIVETTREFFNVRDKSSDFDIRKS